MLELQRILPTVGGVSSYNEVIVDIDHMIKWLPHSIEAVWYMRVSGCDTPGTALLCSAYAKQTRNNLIDQYGIDQHHLPMLEFDPYNWKTPFKQVA